VLRWINGRNPMQYGFDFGLWTRNLVRETGAAGVRCHTEPGVDWHDLARLN